MKNLRAILPIILLSSCAIIPQKTHKTAKPIGNFVDDYQIEYQISENLFFQLPSTKYHILSWHSSYIIAKNDSANSSEPGLYTRIDFTRLHRMEPYSWAFCYTSYGANSEREAEDAAAADTDSLRSGCNGFPFSRLKLKEQK